MPEPIKLLWVDDDPMIHTIIEFAFQDEPGIELRLCASGLEAVVAAQVSRPDLVLLDVVMPDMDGPATLTELRRLPTMATVPMVFVTAESEVQAMQDLLCLGAVGVINKPIDVPALRVQVRTFAHDHASPRVQGELTEAARRETHAVDLQLLRKQYAASLIERLLAIRESSEQYFQDNGSNESLRAVHMQAHSLAGSAGTFGYAKLGDAARTLEHVTNVLPSDKPQGVDRIQLKSALAKLFACALDITESA